MSEDDPKFTEWREDYFGSYWGDLFPSERSSVIAAFKAGVESQQSRIKELETELRDRSEMGI